MDIEAQQELLESCCNTHLSFLKDQFGFTVRSQVSPVGLVYANQVVDFKLYTESYGSLLSLMFFDSTPRQMKLRELTKARNMALDFIVPLDLPSKLLKMARRKNPSLWDTNAEKYIRAAYELAVVHVGTCLRECALDVMKGDFRIVDRMVDQANKDREKMMRSRKRWDLDGYRPDRTLRPVVEFVDYPIE